MRFKKYFPFFLFFFHLTFAILAFEFVQGRDADAYKYWFHGHDLTKVSWQVFFQPGTDIIKIIAFPLVKYLNLPFWSGFLLFSLISYFGFYRLWVMILSLTGNNRTALLLGVFLLLLPNLHFWTSFIGKESILFVALVIIIEKVLVENTISKTFIFSFIIVAIIRPHVAIVLLIAFLIAFFWKGKLKIKGKLYLIGFASLSFILMYFILQKVAFIKDNNPIGRITHIYDYHIERLKNTSSYVPLDEYTLPYKIFTFYFRPLPFEKIGWIYEIWSLENTILLSISLVVLYQVCRNFKVIKWDLYEIFAIFAIVLIALMYVYAYANYGLLARTKIMVMPFIYILMIKILFQTVGLKFKGYFPGEV